MRSDTTEVDWNKLKNLIHDAASNTLKRNTPKNKKLWMNDNIISYNEERKKYNTSTTIMKCRYIRN